MSSDANLGHTPPVLGVSLKQTFPQFLWVNFEPDEEVTSRSVLNDYAFKITQPDQFLPFPEGALTSPRVWVHGYFFNAKCMRVNAFLNITISK